MERPERLLGLTQKRVNHIAGKIQKVWPDEDLLLFFIGQVKDSMWYEQPNLAQFMIGIGKDLPALNQMSYDFGYTLAYQMMPDRIKYRPLTTSHLAVVNRSVMDRMVIEKVGDCCSVSTDLRSYENKLASDSPEFRSFLDHCLKVIPYEQLRDAFTVGALTVTMPFYFREHAKKLGDNLFWPLDFPITFEEAMPM